MDTSFISAIAFFSITLMQTLLVSCKTSDDKNFVKQVLSSEIDDNTDDLSISGDYFFSSKVKKDKFSLTLSGQDTLSSQIKFEIFSDEKLIYAVTFNAVDLLDYSVPQNANKFIKLKFVKSRLNHFFDLNNFVQPAIESVEYDQYDYDLIGKDVWEEVKNGEPYGFFYKLGEENLIWIVFLKSQNRVIVYKTCC